MSENKEIQVKLYFSELKNLLNFITKQNPFDDIQMDWQKLICDLNALMDESRLHEAPDLEQSLVSFAQKWTSVSEHVGNILMIMESYLEMQSKKEDK